MNTNYFSAALKKSVVAMIVFPLCISGFCQSFNIKKDIVTKDKVPYVKMTGTSSMFKPANLLISSLGDAPLFTIKTWTYPNSNPKFKKLKGFKVDFSASGKSLVKLWGTDYLPTNRETIFEFLLTDFKKDLIVNDAINADAENEFIKLYDGNDTIQQAFEYEKSFADYLKNYFPIDRNTDAPLTFTQVKETKARDGSIVRVMDVYQGKAYLITVTTELTSMAVYTFSRKMDKPFIYGTESSDIVTIATATVDASVFTTPTSNPTAVLFSSIAGKDEEVKVPIPNKGEKELVEFLVKNKYL